MYATDAECREHDEADVGSVELAEYCLHALPAAGQATNIEQMGRLVRVVLDGLGCSLDVHDGDQIEGKGSSPGVRTEIAGAHT